MAHRVMILIMMAVTWVIGLRPLNKMVMMMRTRMGMMTRLV